MLIDFSLENSTSFKSKNSLSFLPVTDSDKDNILLPNIIKTQVNNIDLLKSSIILGANASGKSNLINGLKSLKKIVCYSIESVSRNILDSIIPYKLCENSDLPISYQVSFLKKDTVYEYSLSIKDGKLRSEQLVIWKNGYEETMFVRQENIITQYSELGFSEIKDFIDENNVLQKTRDNVPLISVLAKFNGCLSLEVFNYFNNDLLFLSGIDLESHGAVELLAKDNSFKKWIERVLPIFQIHSIEVKEIEVPKPKQSLPSFLDDSPRKALFEKFINALDIKQFEVKVFKSNNGKLYEFPIHFESEGTQKALGILSSIYSAVKENKVLIIDEFDSKFHTLLSKFIFHIFNETSRYAQLIAVVQDANLLDTNIFRRDQIWFVEKENEESKLFSLIEYKEKYGTLKNSYSEDYTQGLFGAIPYFPNSKDILELMQ